MTRRLLGLALASLTLAACSLAGDITPPPDLATAQAARPLQPPASTSVPASMAFPARAPDVAAGHLIYAAKCAHCHGATGLGDGPQAANLPNAPARLSDPASAFKARPADWYALVTQGNTERFMPGFDSLTDAERWDVVAYSLTLSTSTEFLDQGKAFYEAHCIQCHGPSGTGTANLSALEFMASTSIEDLYGVISRGVDERMPGFAESLSEGERWAVAAYVRTLAFQGSDTAVQSSGKGDESAEPELGAAKRITGKVTDGTLGGKISAPMDVTLLAFDGDTQVLSKTNRTDAQGNFEFGDLEPKPGRLYAVTAEYQGVTYNTEFAHLPEGEATIDLPLRIYETTTETDAVRIDRLHVLFDFTVPEIAKVIELCVMSNLGNWTVASSDGRGGLEIVLPDGASQPRFEEDPAFPDRFVPSPQGFLDTAPLLPGAGTSQIVFSFDLPYDGELDFVQPINIPVDAVVLLMPEGGPKLRAEGLQDMGVREVSGATLRNYRLGPLSDGQALRLNLTGRPAPGAATPGGFPQASLAIGFGALGIAVVAVGLWWFRRSSEAQAQPRRLQMQNAQQGPDGEKNGLIQAIADLDDDFEGGRIQKAVYHQRRDELKRLLLPLMRDDHD